MTERAQALEALKRVARDIGTVKDVASRRSDPDRDNRRMLARLSAWRSEILRALNILEAVPPRPPVGSPTTLDMGQGWFVTAGRWGDSIVTIEEKSLSGKPDFTPEDQALVRGAALHLLAFIGQPTPVEPAGASEPPSEAGVCTDCGGAVFHRAGQPGEFNHTCVSPVAPEPPTETPIDKRTTGLYQKFVVTRTDGSSAPGGKHDGCDYFVLDLTHDTHAMPALRAYADSCRADYPLLAADLDRKSAPASESPSEKQRD